MSSNTQLFSVDHKSPWCFNNYFLFGNKNIAVRVTIMDPPASPPSKKNKQLLKIHWGYTLAEVRLRCNNYLTKTVFLQNCWSCPQAYCAAGRRQKSLQNSEQHEIVYTFWRIPRPKQSILSNVCGHFSMISFSLAFIFVLVTRHLDVLNHD